MRQTPDTTTELPATVSRGRATPQISQLIRTEQRYERRRSTTRRLSHSCRANRLTQLSILERWPTISATSLSTVTPGPTRLTIQTTRAATRGSISQRMQHRDRWSDFRQGCVVFLRLETRCRGPRWMWTSTFRAWSSARSAVVCSRRRRGVAAGGGDRKQRRLRQRPMAPRAAVRASAYPHSSPAGLSSGVVVLCGLGGHPNPPLIDTRKPAHVTFTVYSDCSGEHPDRPRLAGRFLLAGPRRASRTAVGGETRAGVFDER